MIAAVQPSSEGSDGVMEDVELPFQTHHDLGREGGKEGGKEGEREGEGREGEGRAGMKHIYQNKSCFTQPFTHPFHSHLGGHWVWHYSTSNPAKPVNQLNLYLNILFPLSEVIHRYHTTP